MGAAVLRSEGQRQLLAKPGSLRELARQLGGSSAQGINEWRQGVKIPTPRFRALLEARFGIPVSAWCEAPIGEPGAVPPRDTSDWTQPTPPPMQPMAPAPLVVVGQGTPHTLDECARLLANVRAMAANRDLDSKERLRFADSEARILALQGRLQAANELRETRYCFEHPAFLRAVQTITAALHPYPQAARAVAAALDGLGVGV